MKPLKTILLSGIVTLGAFSMIAYTSCSKDKCEGVDCNTGTCVDGSCKCPTGYEGANCEVESAGKFTGVFNATDNCPLSDRTGDDLKYTVTIYQDNSDPLKVKVVGVANTSYVFDASVSGKKLTIADQTMDDERVYSGTITYDTVKHLTMSFTIEENGTPVEACTSKLVGN